jgi:hypothetical protein
VDDIGVSLGDRGLALVGHGTRVVVVAPAAGDRRAEDEQNRQSSLEPHAHGFPRRRSLS